MHWRGLVLLAVATSGCAEMVSFRSVPSGASVYVDDQPIGKTPVLYSTESRPNLRLLRQYQIDYRGKAVYRAEIPTRTSGGRVVGAIFTLGLGTIFFDSKVFARDEINVAIFAPTEPAPVFFAQPGTGSLTGQAFAVTVGGDLAFVPFLPLQAARACLRRALLSQRAAPRHGSRQ